MLMGDATARTMSQSCPRNDESLVAVQVALPAAVPALFNHDLSSKMLQVCPSTLVRAVSVAVQVDWSQHCPCKFNYNGKYQLE